MVHKVKIRAAVGAAALVLALGLGAGSASAASVPEATALVAVSDAAPAAVDDGIITPMSASGVQPIGLGGYLYHNINGNGLSWASETATYSPSPTLIGAVWGSSICNWRIDFQHTSSSGAVKTWTGSTNPCATIVSRTIAPISVPSAGSQCAKLYTGGVLRGQQCHSVR